METVLFYRLWIVIGIIVLTEKFFTAFKVGEPARTIILIIEVVLGILWLIFGTLFLPVR